jgi:hypothetical protein
MDKNDYANLDFILLVGEGNFSYSASLARSLSLESQFDEIHNDSQGKCKIIVNRLSPSGESVCCSHPRIRIIATDFKRAEVERSVIETDPATLRNIREIKSQGGFVFTDVDATKLDEHDFLQKHRRSIRKIIFNFPHVQRKKMHIGANRELLKRFFVSASRLIPREREI